MARPVALPHQPDRRVEQLAERERERDRRTLPPHLDGDGQLLSDVELPATTTVSLAHRLGRMPRGYQVLHVRGSAAVETIRRSTADTWSAQQIKLRNDGSAAVTVDLWVY